jgi:hypothetical protein
LESLGLFFVGGVQEGKEALSGAVVAGSDGRRGDVRDVCDLCDAEPLKLSKQPDFAEGLIDMGEQPLNLLEAVARFELRLGALGSVLDGLCVASDMALSSLAAADVMERDVARDAMEPGSKASLAAIAIQRRQEFQEDSLDQVLDLAGVPEHPLEIAAEIASVGPVEGQPGLFIARAASLKQRALIRAQRHGVLPRAKCGVKHLMV